MCSPIEVFPFLNIKDSTKYGNSAISCLIWIIIFCFTGEGLVAQMLNFQYVELQYRAERADAPLQVLNLPYGQDTVNNHFQIRYKLDSQENRLRINLRALLPLHLEKVSLKTDYQTEGEDSRYFCNGFQSWTTSREYSKTERIRKLSPLLNAYSKNAGDYFIPSAKRKKGQLHSWSWTYWRDADSYNMLASLGELSGFSRFWYNTHAKELEIEKICSGYRVLADKSYELFDILYAKGEGYIDYQDFMDCYADLWHQKYGTERPSARPARGWTSWYHYYDKIDETIIEKNLSAFAEEEIDIDIFQIDDGYQAAIGDWLITNKKFPKGMAALAAKIHERGYQAGLWLAPFIVGKNSAIYKAHPDWIVRKANGKPLKIAKNVIWKTTYYALDLSKTEAQAHIKKVVKTILHEWDYDLIKVDFLFALSVQGRMDRTSAQILRDGMQLLRDAAGPDKQILACGVPLASCFGLVDYCRIGNDAHLGWEFGVLKRLRAHERPSTWSTLTNTIVRSPLAGNFFLNDPDVFILRKQKTKLNWNQKETMFLVNHLFGQVLFSSDYIQDYKEETSEYYKTSFPFKQPLNIQVDQFDKDLYRAKFNIGVRSYAAYLNLNKKTQQIEIPVENGLYFDAENAKVLNLDKQKGIRLEGFKSKCFYQLMGDDFELLGGDGHIYAGAEIDRLSWEGTNSLQLYYHPHTIQKKAVYIRILDENIKEIELNAKKYEVREFSGFRGIRYEP